MPKMKTHKGTAKRFRATGSGKLVHKKAGASHNMAKKKGSRKRRLNAIAVIARVDHNRIASLLGVKGKAKAASSKVESNDQS